MNGLLIYAFSAELSSNFYFNATQFTAVYTLAMMFVGQGFGSALAGFLHPEPSEQLIRKFLILWAAVITLTFGFIIFYYAQTLSFIQAAVEAGRVGEWAKVSFIGLIQLPAFMVEGMIFATIFGLLRKEQSPKIPIYVALSVIGAALGYVLGLIAPDFPGIHALVISIVLTVLGMVFVPPVFVPAVLAASFLLSGFLNLDQKIESLTHPEFEHFVQVFKAEPITYDWSRFQKVLFMKYRHKNQEQIRLTYNGTFQVMVGSEELSKNLGYDVIYNENTVKNKDVLILAAGAGRSIQLMMKYAPKSVTAVEIEPSIEKNYELLKPYNDAIFDHPKVDFITGDGRYVLDAAKKKFDLIVIEGIRNPQAAQTLSATTEGFLFTSEALLQAREKLNPGGLIIVFGTAANHVGRSLLSLHPEIKNDFDLKQLFFKVRHPSIDFQDEGVNYNVSILFLAQGSPNYGSPVDLLKNHRDPEQLVSDISFQDVEPSKARQKITDDRPYPYHMNISKVAHFKTLAIAMAIFGLVLFSMGLATSQIGFFHSQFIVLGFGLITGELHLLHQLHYFMGDTMLSFSLGITVLLIFFALGNSYSEKLKLNYFLFSLLWLASYAWFYFWMGREGFSIQQAVRVLPINFGGQLIKCLYLCLCMGPISFLMGSFFPRMIAKTVDPGRATRQMGWAMLLDSVGVCAGFFVFTYVAVGFGNHYMAPWFLGSYLVLAVKN